MTVVKLPRRVRPIDPWFGLLTEASNSPGRPVNIRYMVSPFRYEFVALPQIDLSALAFKSSETKFAQLDRNYRNDASIAEAKAKLHSRAGAAYTSVAVELKGPQAKAGTSQGRCMQSLVVTVHPKGSTAHVFYRSTELVAKLAADFAFLEGIVGELGIEPTAWHFTFANAYLCPIHVTSALAL